MSEPIQTISQNNYILQAPPPTATMFTTELEYDGDKISGYAGSAFKAGTDLEFGYDSADNISAINNSAISQTPSQKLYLQSPLTTGVSGTSAYIGIESSAQYNETVLWSGASQWKENPTFNLFEPASNFEYIEFQFTPYNDGSRASVCQRFVQSNLEYDVNGVGFYGTSGLRFNRARVKNSDNNATALNMTDAIEWCINVNSTTWISANAAMNKIIGINRKENS